MNPGKTPDAIPLIATNKCILTIRSIGTTDLIACSMHIKKPHTKYVVRVVVNYLLFVICFSFICCSIQLLRATMCITMCITFLLLIPITTALRPEGLCCITNRFDMLLVLCSNNNYYYH